MNIPNDGGPAFARPGFTSEQTESQEGMSLRDWFAGMALQGLLASNGRMSDESANPQKIVALAAYKCADAMLAERAKEKP